MKINNPSILKLLDETIHGWYESKNEYPKIILMSKEIKDKLFEELNGQNLYPSWADSKDNYRGIKIEEKENILIELK